MALLPGRAAAGGYDLPTTYSARHVGMGGTAVAYVDDPSALFHNPAGLAHIGNITLMADISLMMGHIEGAPEVGVQATSDLAIAPLFLIGAGFRVTDWLVVGLVISPVAAAGASYTYESTLGRTEDRTQAMFLEASPGLAFDLPWGLHVGAGYRITVGRMERYKKGAEAPGPGIDMTLWGFGFTGFRVGVQWQAVEDDPVAPAWDRRRLQVGVCYRHQVTVDLSTDSGVALAQDADGISTTALLPSKISAGVRGDYERLGVAVDFEYGFNGQNDETEIEADIGGSDFRVPNLFRWQDTITVRMGLEVRLLDAGQLAVRAGYVYDGQTADRAYPTAFGPPPAETHTVTLGAGYDFGGFEVNLAYAYRSGAAEVTAADLEGADLCPFCGGAGDYRVNLHGVFLDVTYDFE